MGEYVININWGRGGGGGRSSGSGNKQKTYLDGHSLLPAAVLGRIFNQNSVAPDTFYGSADYLTGDGQERKEWQKIQQGVVLSQVHRFFWSKESIGTKTGTVSREDYPSLKDVPETAWEWSEKEKLKITAVHGRTIAYTAAQALRLANLGFSTHYQYASAIASSTAELNAVNEYQNAMTGLGIVSSIAAGAVVGAKVGSIAGPVGTAIGAGIGTAVAITNKAVSTWNENRILNYKQAINATTSAYQLGVLGDATYGRSRQSIG